MPPKAPQDKMTHLERLQKKRKYCFLALNQDFGNVLQENSPDQLIASTLHYESFAAIVERICGGGHPHCTVVSFGHNDNLQLGLPEDLSNFIVPPGPVELQVGNCVRSIACGALHSVLLTNQGIPYTWGNCDKGCLGHMFPEDGKIHPVESFKTSDGKDENGTIVQIAAGDGHTMFLSFAGTSTLVDSDSLEVRDGPLQDDGCLEGWNEAPVHIPFPSRVKEIAAGTSISAAITEDGKVYTWGMGNNGNLARSAEMGQQPKPDGSFDLSPLGFPYKHNKEGDERPSYNHRTIRKHFLTPKPVCWNPHFNGRHVLCVAVGESHIICSATGAEGYGQVFTSGLNDCGQLGHGDYTDRHQMTLGGSVIHWFASSERTACQLGMGCGSNTERFCNVFNPVLFPEDVSIVQVEAAENQSFALARSEDYKETKGMDLWSWGQNFDRVLGHSDKDKHESADEDIYFRPTKLDLSDLKEKKGPSATITRVFGVSAGTSHTLLMTKNFKKE